MLEEAEDRQVSPPWDLEDDYVGPPITERALVRDSTEDGEVGPPPPSQLKTADRDVSGREGGASRSPLVEEVGGKTTPLTLSDDVDEDVANDAMIGRRRSRGGAASKKRSGSKQGELDEWEEAGDEKDSKPKPRKSARLA